MLPKTILIMTTQEIIDCIYDFIEENEVQMVKVDDGSGIIRYNDIMDFSLSNTPCPESDIMGCYPVADKNQVADVMRGLSIKLDDAALMAAIDEKVKQGAVSLSASVFLRIHPQNVS
jgi:hypothetical protein